MAKSLGVWLKLGVRKIFNFKQFPFWFLSVLCKAFNALSFISFRFFCKAFNARLISDCKAFWPNSSFLLGLGVLPFLPFRVLVYKLSYDVIFGRLDFEIKLRELSFLFCSLRTFELIRFLCGVHP